jgi:DNA polymerase-1
MHGPPHPSVLPLLIIDADSLMHRAYHAMPPVKGRDGRPVGALLGFTNMLLTAWDANPSRAVATCLDSREPGYRSALHPPYQGQRDPFDPAIVEQLDDLQAFMGAFGIYAPRVAPHEADDLLATLVEREEARGGKALVLTSDRDAFQLVSERTTVLRPGGAGRDLERVDRDGVVARYGVLPEQVVDLIALRGDPSDNIPGARGVGAKTAASLLQRHGDLDGVIEAASAMPQARRSAIADHVDELELYRRVAAMDRSVPGVEPPADAEPDWLGGACAARERGIDRLAERLEERAAATSA